MMTTLVSSTNQPLINYCWLSFDEWLLVMLFWVLLDWISWRTFDQKLTSWRKKEEILEMMDSRLTYLIRCWPLWCVGRQTWLDHVSKYKGKIGRNVRCKSSSQCSIPQSSHHWVCINVSFDDILKWSIIRRNKIYHHRMIKSTMGANWNIKF